MNHHQKLFTSAFAALLIGVGIGTLLTNIKSSPAADRQPLYWVAPMDANYRKDGPGKSPMGMDLVPVYEQANSDNHELGLVKISPNVVNNLGVRIGEAKQDVLHTEIKTVAYIKYDEGEIKHIHSRVEGWIEKLHVKASGDPVKLNQPLYDLYSPDLVNAQEEYLLALSRNKKDLIDAVEHRLQALQLSPQFIKQLKSNRQVQQTVTFYAPQNGVLENLNIREGFYVKPETTLMSIGKLNRVWVEAEVFERQAALVEAGLPVTMTLDYQQGREWQGLVDYVYPTLDPKTRTLRVRLKFDNQDLSLKPNMFAQVEIIAESSAAMVLVPNEAIIRTGDHNIVVLALGDGQFKSIIVNLGPSNDDYTAINHGLEAGDKIVISAQFLIDSESSKTSDFKRISNQDIHSNKGYSPYQVTTQANIITVNKQDRTAHINHQAITKWSWPSMKMTLQVSENLDIDALNTISMAQLQLTKNIDGSVIITDFQPIKAATSTTPTSETQNPSELSTEHSNEHNHQGH